MPKKPLIIVIIAVCFLISPFFIILQASLITNTPVIGPYNITAKFSPHDWIIIALYIICAAAVFFVKKWGWYVFILSSLYFIGSNLAIFFLRPRYGAAALILYNLILVIVAGIFFRRAVIAPYFNPRIRWWEQAPRLTINIYAEIASEGATAEIIDISSSGIFITSQKRLALGSACSLTIHCLSHSVSLESIVMRCAQTGEGTGYGLMFVNTGDIEKTRLDNIIRDLSQAGTINRSRQKQARKIKNRAVAPRFRVHTGISLKTAEGPCQAILLDLSKGGCRIKPTAACALPLNQPCTLAITCLNMELVLDGVPRWSGSHEGEPVIGIAFDLNSSQRARLRAILAACRRGHAPNRLSSSRPLPENALLDFALHSPYRIVYSLKQRLKK